MSGADPLIPVNTGEQDVSARPFKLLFLAYPFPPSSVVGAVRSGCMAKYLSRLGWQVTVVTPSPGAFQGCSTMASCESPGGAEGITRLVAGESFSNSGKFPGRRPWGRLRYAVQRFQRKMLRPFGLGLSEFWLPACTRALATIKPGDFDVVLATGSPFSTFIAARRIARRLGISYVLDYRDPWSLTIHGNQWKKRIIRPFERRLIHGAAATLMVSDSLAKAHANVFGLTNGPRVVTNGYDPEQLEAVPPMKQLDFAVVYAGSFYKGKIEISPVLKAVKMAAESRKPGESRIRLHYYGNGGQHVKEQAIALGAENLVQCHGRVPREQALAAIRGAGVAVVITSIQDRVDLPERGIMTAKIFEPLGLGVPILLVAPEGGDAADVVEKSGAGKSFRASQVEVMAQWLIQCADGKSGQRYEPPMAYSWPVLAQHVSGILAQTVVHGNRTEAGSVLRKG